ncbi:hypothetical protein C8J57DRAFT_1215238 [Mycena rebaudengoi]|nr:hypothetical protein C8J57DRAFT_1215238 [Mycena rebaudengoi]
MFALLEYVKTWGLRNGVEGFSGITTFRARIRGQLTTPLVCALFSPDLMREFSMNSRRNNCVLNVRNMESFNFVLQRYTANGQTHGCHVDRKYEPHTGPSWVPEADQLGSAVVAYRSIVWPDPTGHQLSLEYGHI